MKINNESLLKKIENNYEFLDECSVLVDKKPFFFSARYIYIL